MHSLPSAIITARSVRTRPGAWAVCGARVVKYCGPGPISVTNAGSSQRRSPLRLQGLGCRARTSRLSAALRTAPGTLFCVGVVVLASLGISNLTNGVLITCGDRRLSRRRAASTLGRVTAKTLRWWSTTVGARRPSASDWFVHRLKISTGRPSCSASPGRVLSRSRARVRFEIPEESRPRARDPDPAIMAGFATVSITSERRRPAHRRPHRHRATSGAPRLRGGTRSCASHPTAALPSVRRRCGRRRQAAEHAAVHPAHPRRRRHDEPGGEGGYQLLEGPGRPDAVPGELLRGGAVPGSRASSAAPRSPRTEHGPR